MVVPSRPRRIAGDDASGADDGASGEKPAGDETVLGHLLSDETPTDADDDAPRASADHPDDHPAHLDESRGVTVEAGEDLDDDDDDGDLDEDDASVSTTAAELDAALAASALARSSDPIRWYGGVEPPRPPRRVARPNPRLSPWTRPPRTAPAPARPPSLDFGASPGTTPRTSPEPSRGPSPTSSPRPTPDDSFSDVAISTTASPSPRGNPSSSTEASAPENPSRSRASSRGLDRRDTSSRTFPRDALTVDSSYQKDEATGAWDTPEHARAVLEWLRAGCGDALAELPDPVRDRGDDARGAVEVGLAAFEKGPTRTVRAALEVIEGLRAASRGGKRKVLFAVDEYNAMFGPTDMHEVLGARKRGTSPRGRRAAGVAARRERGGGGGVRVRRRHVGHDSLSPKLSAALTSAEGPGSEALERVEVKRMNTKEIFSMVRHYAHAKGSLEAVHESVDHEQLAMRIKLLTQGNGKEMRR